MEIKQLKIGDFVRITHCEDTNIFDNAVGQIRKISPTRQRQGKPFVCVNLINGSWDMFFLKELVKLTDEEVMLWKLSN